MDVCGVNVCGVSARHVQLVGQSVAHESSLNQTDRTWQHAPGLESG